MQQGEKPLYTACRLPGLLVECADNRLPISTWLCAQVLPDERTAAFVRLDNTSQQHEQQHSLRDSHATDIITSVRQVGMLGDVKAAQYRPIQRAVHVCERIHCHDKQDNKNKDERQSQVEDALVFRNVGLKKRQGRHVRDG